MAPAAPLFLGPAEVTNELQKLDGDVVMEEKQPDLAGNEFMELLKKAMPPGGQGGAPFSHTTPEGHLMGLTENLSATYLTSGNACLDFFFQVVPGMNEVTLLSLLERAWTEEALTALKLVFHLRGVRGTGKSDKEAFYWAALWLHKHHPATLRQNIVMTAEFGYFKDSLELLLRLVEGPAETKSKAEAKLRHRQVISQGKRNAKIWEGMKKEKKRQAAPEDAADIDESDVEDHDFVYVKHRSKASVRGYYTRKGASARAAALTGTLKPREERIAASVAKDQAESQRAAVVRKEKKLGLARKVAKIYAQDLKFRALYMEVADVFANRLKGDLEALKEGRLFDISLAGKWAPSLDSSYDLRTLLCYAIATRIFPKEAYPEYEGMDDRKYGFAVREKLRKEVLVPLRKALELPEVYMSAQRWGDVNYRRVASVAMTNYKTLFVKHDKERFKEFLASVKKGEEKVAAGALLPHEILNNARLEDGESAEVAELQWKRMVEDLKEHGTLCNCLAVCDVSGSMSGVPMEVCIALGMLLSELCEAPWKGHVITFSHNPEIHVIAGESLKEKYEFTRRMEWGMNTNLQLVFDKVLTMAQLNKLAPEKMIRRLFIFSDMEFDVASTTPWETDYGAICRKFQSACYGTPPEVVFWNLRCTTSIPAMKLQKGVALVSGFSKNILKIFLKDDGAIDPMKSMRTAIEGEAYSKLKVVD